MNTHREDKPLLAKARDSSSSSTHNRHHHRDDGFSATSKMVGAGTLALLAGAGTLSATRAYDARAGLGVASSSSSSSSSSSNVVTLTLGCSPPDLLSLLPFEPQSWAHSHVGVKFVSSSMSKTFEFSKAKEMIATNQCGVYQLPYEMSENSKFGFYLYEKENPNNHMSDIGAQVKGGPVSEASIRAAGWLNDKNAASNHAKTIDIEDMRKAAKIDAQNADAASKRIAEKTFHTKTETTTQRSAAATGDKVVADLGLVETRTYSNFNGNARSKSDAIACDGLKKTCTLKSCAGAECTEYTKHDCEAGKPGCKVSADFKNPANVAVRTTEEKKFFQKPMSSQEKVREQNRDMVEKAQKDLGTTTVEVLPPRRRLLSKIFDIKNSVKTALPEMGYGHSHPTRVIRYMASCTTKHVTEDAEFYPRTHDASNPGNTYVFGSCFNNRDQQTCKIPTEVLAPGCPGSSASLAKTVINPITKTASLSGESLNHLTNQNIQMEVAKCLGDDPIKGDCPKQKFGKISSWDVSRVTDMSQLFDHPPLKNKNDRYSSFNGDLGNWDVSNVKDMKLMFSRALAFEGKNLNKWDTKNVENMSGMFKHADRFNAMISGWNTGKVRKMNVMFQNAFAFDQDISRWDVSNVNDFTRMFAGTFDKGFGQDISAWNVRPHARQVDMFFEAYNFQSKFVCDHVDHGPISSCVGATASAGKSESELMEMAKQKAAEDEADDNDYLEENPSFFLRFKHWLQN